MALTGRMPKPAALRHNQTKRPEIGVVSAPPPDRLVPRAPSGLSAAAKRRWAAFWQSPVSMAVDVNADRHLLERWITCSSEYDLVFAVLRRQRVVRGSMGQPAITPLAGYLAQMAAEIRACERELGIGPSARLRLGMAFGQVALTALELNRQLDEQAPPADDDPELGEWTDA